MSERGSDRESKKEREGERILCFSFSLRCRGDEKTAWSLFSSSALRLVMAYRFFFLLRVACRMHCTVGTARICLPRHSRPASSASGQYIENMWPFCFSSRNLLVPVLDLYLFVVVRALVGTLGRHIFRYSLLTRLPRSPFLSRSGPHEPQHECHEVY